ncbi:MAG: hypothetical protein H7Y31_08445, partial [Chitinophagaceae bacterium]|nr:hypothetical protein [Chitinophagaceae bacterium]
KFPSLSNVQLILWRTVLSAAILNFYLNLNFYPDLLQYQSGSQAAIYANKHFRDVPVVQLRKEYSYALEFYLHAPLITVDSVAEINVLPDAPFLLYVPTKTFSDSTATTVQRFEHFPVSRLDGKFINFKTRRNVIGTFQLDLIK